jgi:hypothetical protein
MPFYSLSWSIATSSSWEMTRTPARLQRSPRDFPSASGSASSCWGDSSRLSKGRRAFSTPRKAPTRSSAFAAARPLLRGRCCVATALGVRSRGRDASYPAPPARIRTCTFMHTACMGLSLSMGIIVFLCHSILLFDPRREHSSAPTAYFHCRRAQRRSRTALLQRRRRLVLDGREHGGRLPAIGRLAVR